MNERARLKAGLECIGIATLSDKTIGDLLCFLDELLEWNKRVNLTAIKERDEAIEKHLVDSLTVCSLIAEGSSVLDLGSGGGFPGIPLKIVRPDIRALLVDAVLKKVLFQRHACRMLGLKGIDSWHGRAENLSNDKKMRGAFDVVVSRAFSDLESFVRLADPYLRAGGQVVCMKGPEGLAEYDGMKEGILGLGFCCRETKPLTLPFSGAKRTILVLERRD